MNINNRVAFITGASSGIGKAIAKKLSETGCKVILASRDLKKLNALKNELVGESIVVEVDVSQTESVAKAFKKARVAFGKIDILINSAGVMPLTYLKNRHLDEWLQTIEVNVKGCLRCIHAALPSMISNKQGHIINISSVDGKEFYKGGAIYGASKSAIIALSKAMRMELSPDYNIRVTCIEPGTVDTNLRDSITDEELLNDKDYDNEDEPKLNANNIADAVLYALNQPENVNVNELLIKPTNKQ
ncbi:SDR family oxidoreductase [Zunongwangia sp.]|uniref:SDR family oxidoreductase n=1 Tax=Zunongwangia sp. TaxID=1965325 RepID=UPI003AA8DC10